MKEFFLQYIATDDATEVSPGTILGYWNGPIRILKAYGCPVYILRDPTYAENNNGYRQVVDDQSDKQQAKI